MKPIHKLLLATMIPSLLLWNRPLVSRDKGENVSRLVTERSGLKLEGQTKPEEGAEGEPLKQLLRKQLSADDAVQIALWNNNSFKATMEELGIARADLRQAGLPENPEVATSFQFPHSGPTKVLPHVTATQNVLDFFLLSLRKKAASSQLEETKLKVADSALDLVAKVKAAFYHLQAIEQFRSLLKNVAQSARTAAELSKRQYDAGNVNKLELNSQQVLAQQAEIELARTETEASLARERLSELLGLQGYPETWKVKDRLPNLPNTEPSLKNLEEIALAQRLDMAAARQRMTTLDRDLKLAKWQIVPSVKLGVESEEEIDGRTRTGPEIDLQIPLFDLGQARRSRIRAQMQQGRYGVAALENQARTEVRSAWTRLKEARNIAKRYQDQMIPLLKESLEEAQRHYNFMLLGTFQLLQAKREQINAERQYIEAIRDYWIERANLEKAVGGQLKMARTLETDGDNQP